MNKRNNLNYFPIEKNLEKICEELSTPNYPRVNKFLPKNASSLEKSKYFLCKKILSYKSEHDLSVENLAKQIDLTIPEIEDILFARYDKFTLDRLVSYLDNLFPFHLDIHEITAKNSTSRTISKH